VKHQLNPAEGHVNCEAPSKSGRLVREKRRSTTQNWQMGVNILTPLDIHSPDLLHFKKAGFAKKDQSEICMLLIFCTM